MVGRGGFGLARLAVRWGVVKVVVCTGLRVEGPNFSGYWGGGLGEGEGEGSYWQVGEKGRKKGGW